MEKNYKDTLFMPNTKFDMRANLSTKEPQYRQWWLEQKIYQKALLKNKNNTPFVLHDGPPYANGSIHVGHALNKIIKDVIVRYKTMQGFYSPFVPGWDTHGLPIENKMLDQIKMDHKNISVTELRKQAHQYALSQIEIQKEQFSQLQMLSDFSKIYVTLDPKYEANQLRLFKKMYLNGYVYKGLKPIYWSPSSQSALAEAEVEYKEHTSPSIQVAFKLLNGNDILDPGDNLVIWTTTPWTLIANSGVAVGENFDYVKVKHQQNNYVVAAVLLEKVAELAKWSEYEIIQQFKGSQIVGLEYSHPLFSDKKGKVVVGHHVTTDAGTGLVHIAPLFGEDDFIIGKKENLDMILHVEDDGTLNQEARQFANLFYADANKNIGLFLDEQQNLLSLKFIKHSYPHDWRTHKPIIFRGTPQWFVSIDKVRANILKELEHVKTYHEWAAKRLRQMIENRADWTISRQRSWGVPIIIFYDENKNVVNNEEIFDYVIDLVEQHGSDIWFNSSVDELLPNKYRGLNWTKETNIMDVWFDSGSSAIAADIDNSLSLPWDLYFEGSDQYRGWFNSSIINTVVYTGKSPYKELLSHGFVVDEQGRKMSKSLNNGVDPLDIVNNHGADILRLWAANSEFANDVSISKNIINQNVEIYRKIRNTLKFLLGNLNEYNEHKDIVLEGVHYLIDQKLKDLKNKIIDYYDKYNFLNVVKGINNFIIDLSGFYLSITKDALYADSKQSVERQQILFNYYNILETLTIALAPILPTTTEEVYSYLQTPKQAESVHLLDFFKKSEVDHEIIKQWDEFFDFKDNIYRLIENEIQNQTIKRVNEVKLTIPQLSDFIMSLDLVKLLMVGKVVVGNDYKVETFDSEKCQRCWNHIDVQLIKNNLCPRCREVIGELQE